jgi:hypothetical protein
MANVLCAPRLPCSSSILFCVSVPSAPLEPADHRRFIAEAGLPTWRRILGMLPLLLLVFTSPNFVLTLALVAWLWVQLVVDTNAHHRRLEALGFDPAFRSRLRRVSYLADMVIVLLSASMLLRRL